MSEFGPETNPYGSFMMEPAVPEGTSARAGAKLIEGQTPKCHSQVMRKNN